MAHLAVASLDGNFKKYVLATGGNPGIAVTIFATLLPATQSPGIVQATLVAPETMLASQSPGVSAASMVFPGSPGGSSFVLLDSSTVAPTEIATEEEEEELIPALSVAAPPLQPYLPHAADARRAIQEQQENWWESEGPRVAPSCVAELRAGVQECTSGVQEPTRGVQESTSGAQASTSSLRRTSQGEQSTGGQPPNPEVTEEECSHKDFRVQSWCKAGTDEISAVPWRFCTALLFLPYTQQLKKLQQNAEPLGYQEVLDCLFVGYDVTFRRFDDSALIKNQLETRVRIRARDVLRNLEVYSTRGQWKRPHSRIPAARAAREFLQHAEAGTFIVPVMLGWAGLSRGRVRGKWEL